MGTTRCDCRQLSFIALRSYAQRHGITGVDELIRQTGCCTDCGTCRPHLEEFLRTGELRYGDQVFKLPGTSLPLPAETERAAVDAAAPLRNRKPPAELA